MATPNYLLAADNHNLAGSGSSWYNPASWDVSNGGNFAAASVLSGYNSLYNTAAQVGSWLGADTAQRDTSTYIASYDSDLGQYYQRNKESVDLVGFIGTSLIPGIAGIKAFNLGQMALKTAIADGAVGGNFSRALGVLIPKTDMYVKLAGAEINSSMNGVKLLNGNTLKALASGVHQNVLESVAAETVVQATMFKSPVLDQQDMRDILTNIAIGGAFGGVVGGAFTGAKIRGDLKTAVAKETSLREPFTTRSSFVSAASADSKIISLAHDIEMSTVPITLRDAKGELVQNNYSVNKQLYDTKIAKDYNEIRTEIHSLSDSKVVGNMVANMSTPTPGEFGFAQRYLDNFYGALAITTPGKLTRVEVETAKKLAAGEISDVLPEVRYLKLAGEGAGSVTDSTPILLSLGDRFAGKEAVKAHVLSYGFKAKDLWDSSKLLGKSGYAEAEARHIWADSILPEIPKGSLINANDIPLLERAYKDGNLDIRITNPKSVDLAPVIPASKAELYSIIKQQKSNVSDDLIKRFSLQGDIPIELGSEYVAKITNTKLSYIEGNSLVNEVDDLFAHQADYADYLKALKDRNLSLDVKKAEEAVNPYFLPKHAKIVYDAKQGTTPQNVVQALAQFKATSNVFEQESKNVVAKIFGPSSESLPDIKDSALIHADRTGSGPGLVSSENSNYGSIGSTMAWIGSVTKSVKDRFRKETSNALESPLLALASNPKAAIEFESINQKITRSGKLWVRHDDDTGEYLITRDLKKKLDAGIYENLPDELIRIENQETLGAVSTHISQTSKRTVSTKEIRAAQGKETQHDPDVFRPIRPDLKQYKDYVFVVDPRVTGSGHVTMIHAASPKELTELVRRVPPEYKVRTSLDTDEFYKARQDFEYSRTLNENYINSDLASKGVFSNFFPKSDPDKIVNDILQQHFRDSDVLVQETMRLRYEKVFNFFEDMGKRTSQFETSILGSRAEVLEKTIDNPYFNYIKTALDISKAPENRLIYGFNKLLDESFSKAVGTIKNTWFNKVRTEEDLIQINAHLDEFGMKPAYYDSSLQALANHTAPRGELTKFVRKGSSLLSLFTLGLDPLNALNNAIGSNILRFTELKHLTRAISEGNSKIAGELSELAKVAVPGVGDEIFSPAKLVGRAFKNYFVDMSVDKNPLMSAYRAEGIIKSREDQLKLLIDDFTLKGTESVAELNSRSGAAFTRLKALADKGERITLNAQAEEFNRFISANVMDQITDIARANGLMSVAEAKAYRNTFVNRVEGNILASQRPLAFQGPIGQAISLFQSYQFNLIQQLFRYTAEGTKKDLAMLAGLQSTLYGIQSLPAFQFINTHIIGQLSGNKEHRDTYDAVYGVVGKTAGNWMLYGAPSNILQTNIYSRGDINPRQITILPTNLQEIPIVAGWGKFALNLKETFSKIGAGGNTWQTILQGIEHNGISRPLAGIAQVAQSLDGGKAFSTTNQGSILGSNDLFHIASLSRIAGGRPLDEAVTNDALFRVKTYDATRRAQLRGLSEVVKTTLIGGNSPTDEQVNRFAQKHAELGGNQSQFNKYMMSLYKSSNVSQAETLANSLRNPFAYKMQLLMGGEEE